MQVQHILRSIQPQRGFVYSNVVMVRTPVGPTIQIHLQPRKGAKAVCSRCGKKCPGYDVAKKARSFMFVPLWGMPCFFIYKMRRVNCPKCEVVVELVPWATGKQQITESFAWFIASWARTLSWSETGRRFGTTWDVVIACVKHAVAWGLANRNLNDVECIGVDELSWKKGHKYMTLVYQIDHGRRRLLHVAKDRTMASFNSFFDMLGEERSKRIRFVASDMWKAFLTVVRKRCGNAVHVLDRFHVAQLLSKAVDEVRRDEARSLRKAGKTTVLTKTRWLLLKAKKNLQSWQRTRLRDLVKINLRTVRAYLLKEQFQRFWTYTTVWGGRRFLAKWTTMAMRSRLPPFKAFAHTLRKHEKELLNWFLARGSFASGATEGFNNKARVATRKAYGFRTYEHAEIALYHTLGDLPEPPWLTHRFS
jgi:transposase